MANLVTVEGIEMTAGAAENVRETGISPSDDLERLRSGDLTRETLLAECLDGSEDDDLNPTRNADWRAYVDAVCGAAKI